MSWLWQDRAPKIEVQVSTTTTPAATQATKASPQDSLSELLLISQETSLSLYTYQ